MKGDPKTAMPFLAHLGELRKRLIISLVAIAAATIVAFVFSDSILRQLLLPLGSLHLRAFNLMDGFMIRWQIALYTGIVATFPVWAFEMYRFIKPALEKPQQVVIWPILLCACLLFLAGIVFAFYLLFSMVSTLIQLFPPEVEFMPSAPDYISFASFFMLACGLVFQLPTVLIILVRLHIVKARTLVKERRLAYFIRFAFAEIITPVADPIVAPLSVMVPLIVLHEASVFLVFRIERERAWEKVGLLPR